MRKDVMKSIIDQGFRITYFFAYRIMKLYWAIRRPKTDGALIAIWYQGEILLVRTSYHGYYSLPGGYIRNNETAVDAAIRELKEEIGLKTTADELVLAIETQHSWENRNDHVTIFSMEVNEKPRIEIDNREVVSAEFYSPGEALKLDIFPPIRDCIEKYKTSRQ